MNDTSIQFRLRLAQINGIKLNEEKSIKNYHMPKEDISRKSVDDTSLQYRLRLAQIFGVDELSQNSYFKTHFDHKFYDPNDPTREEAVQEFTFGSNDYLPFLSFDDKNKLSLKEDVENHPDNTKRLIIRNNGKSGPKGLVIPRHIIDGAKNVNGMSVINKKRADVYGSEHTEPLSDDDMLEIHKKTLADHFAKPENEQIKAEQEALGRLKKAGHIPYRKDEKKDFGTLSPGEKTDTVEHEFDEKGRKFIAMSAKGIAGHSFYTSGSGENQKHYVINTCRGQTKGCGGGVDAQRIADTTRGTCFAPKAEIQYPQAAINRHCQTQAMADPRMTKDWILAHTGSLRKFASIADENGKRALFRPNVLNEHDKGSSSEVLSYLNAQRKSKNLPSIVSNSYGKTTETHDPENDIYVTYSNTGPKVKPTPHGPTKVEQNITRDNRRVQQTINAADKFGHFLNKNGNKTPPKGSYLVISARRDGPVDKEYQRHTKAIKYWSTGIPENKLSDEEKNKPAEGHYDGEGNSTTPDRAHYGHKTLTDNTGRRLRFSYQMQHVLHPRMVSVGKNDDGSDHMIPTDSRFKDEDFLPKNRYKSPNGKNAGYILVTTPTHSTSIVQHNTSFTHHVDYETVNQIKKNNGIHEIDRPEDQIAAKDKEYQQS